MQPGGTESQLWRRAERPRRPSRQPRAGRPLLSESVQRISKARLMGRCIEPPPELFPSVKLFVEKRANARGVAKLAGEITDARPHAFVICNGVKDYDRGPHLSTGEECQ